MPKTFTERYNEALAKERERPKGWDCDICGIELEVQAEESALHGTVCEECYDDLPENERR
jgi:hypothetical protein